MEIILIAIAVYFFVKKGGLGFLAAKTNRASTRVLVEQYLHQQHKSWLFDADPAASSRLYVEYAWRVRSEYFDGKLHGFPHHMSGAIFTLALAVQKLEEQKSRNLEGVLLAFISAAQALEEATDGHAWKLVDNLLLAEARIIINPILKRQSDKPAYKEAERFYDRKFANAGMPENDASSSTSVEDSRLSKVIDLSAEAGHTSNIYSVDNNKNFTEDIIVISENLGVGIQQMLDFPFNTFEDWKSCYTMAAAKANPSVIIDTGQGGAFLTMLDILDEEPIRRAYLCRLNPELLGAAHGANFNALDLYHSEGVTAREYLENLVEKGDL